MSQENKKPATFSERVSEVEKSVESLQQVAFNQSKTLDLLVENIRQALGVQKEVIDHLVEELESTLGGFKSRLNERLEAVKLEKLKQITEQEKAQITAAVEQGILESTPSVDTDSVVVGVPSKEGKVLGAGRVTFEVSNLEPAVAEQIVGIS